MDLQGTRAIVTGGGRGIGRAIAEALAEAGASVAIGGRTAATLNAAAEAMRSTAAGSVLAVPCDVRNPEDCRDLVQRTVDAFGGVDILVNNAGVGIFKTVEELSPDEWRQVIGTNLDGVFHCTHEALPHLRQGGGWIINIGSLAGKNAFPRGAAYNATKFGLIGFSEALMQEVRHDGVRVSYIMPGSVATDFSSPTGGEDAWKIQPEDIARAVLDLLAMPERTLPSRIEIRPSRPPRR